MRRNLHLVLSKRRAVLHIYSSSIGTTTSYWVLACSTIVEPSQQEVFTECCCQQHVKPPTWRASDQNVPTLATRHRQRLKRRKRTPEAEGGTMGEKWPRILPKVATSTSLLGSFTCHNFTTWDRRLYSPSEGRRTEDFFARKIGRLWPGLNPRTWVPKASTLPPDHRSRYGLY